MNLPTLNLWQARKSGNPLAKLEGSGSKDAVDAYWLQEIIPPRVVVSE
jgi:hypothetical protein